MHFYASRVPCSAVRIAIATKLAAVLAFAVLLVLPSVAGAVLSGANGRIVYVSGRGFTDAQAKLYLRVASGSFGIGLNEGPMSMASGQHRHPTWSPDRTKVAYSLGGDIFILDLTAPAPFAQNFTNTPGATEDRPAWSPDGTRIAYETTAGTDILVAPVEGGTPLNLTNSAGVEGKPAWTPDSAEIYYQVGDPTVANALNIVKEPSGGGTVTNIATSPGENEFQPSLSPDGTQLCFTRGTGVALGAGAPSADIIVSLANGGGQKEISDNVGSEAIHGDYNCTWSPDGLFVAYVRGTFSSGDLVMERADDSQPLPIELEAVPNVFDGNPDWAPDGRPVCEDVAVDTGFNQPVTISVQCFDSGPFYERTQVKEFVVNPEGDPANGTLGEMTQGDQGPSTVTYTPNPGFSGADTLKLTYFDEVAGFGESKTVTVNVGPPPAPDPAPIVSNVTVKPRKWERGSKLPRVSAAVGAKVRWRLSEAASTKLIFQRALPGRRVGKRCVAETTANAARPRCNRFRNAASRTLSNGRAGLNTFSFQGRVTARKTLAPGTYRVAAQARDGAGQLSKTAFSNLFTIVAD